EIRDWTLILFVSAWLAIAYLKLGRIADARRVLDRMFKEVPARTLGYETYAAAYRQIVLAQLRLAEGDTDEALNAVREAISTSQRTGAPLEEGAAHRVLGEICEAMGARADADNAFRGSLAVLEKVQCPPRTSSDAASLWALPEGRQFIGGSRDHRARSGPVRGDECHRLDRGGSRGAPRLTMTRGHGHRSA